MENQSNLVEAATLAGSAAPVDLSMMGLFLRADLVVQLVMLMLLMASVYSWAIIIDKTMRLRRLNSRADQFENAFWSGGSLEQLYDRIGAKPADPMSALFVAAMSEWRRSATAASIDAIRARLPERIERIMGITMSREMERVERQMIFLASTGSTAPFVGLFGTVWGIMNSFQAIAHSKNTSLAVVAPGIAEALFATALGLIAAIPAVVAYNKISKDIDRYAGRMETFAGEFSAILSRQLEEYRQPAPNERDGRG